MQHHLSTAIAPLPGLALLAGARPAATADAVPSCPPAPMRVMRPIDGPVDYLGACL